jgi:hypothetical protein
MNEGEALLNERRMVELENKTAASVKVEADHEKRISRTELLIETIKEKAEEYVSRQEFTPVRMIVYGLAVTALTGLVSAILSKVLVR